MRICSPQLGLAPQSTLGGEVFDREILLGLAKAGFEVEIILPKNKAHDKNIKNWHFTYLPISHFPAPLGNFLFLPYIFKTYQQKEFQMLRIHQPQFLGVCAIFLKIFLPKVRVLATYHQFRETRFSIFSKKINNLWDHIICDSQNVKILIVKRYNVPAQKITVVHNGVPNYLKPTPKDKILAHRFKIENRIVLLFMGFFSERKNPIFILEVLAGLIKKRPDLVLIFWGKGPFESQIQKRAKQLGIIDNIRFQKPIFGEEKNKIHNLADIFVHPALDEGFALAPLESMACAKPVVMTNGYSAREAVEDGINGFLAHANDIHEWSEKLGKLIDDRKLRDQMGKRSRALVKREFQWDKSVQKHLQVLSKIN